MAEKPNKVFIITDQQALRTTGKYGNPIIQTPHMDSLAEYGVSFTNSYCTSPVCSSARASLVTGRMPYEVDVDFNDMSLIPGIPTMGEIFREAGYETVWTGKWNIPESFPTAHDAIPGFEYRKIRESPQKFFATTFDPLATDNAVEFIEGEHHRPFLLSVSLLNPHDICHWIMDRAPEFEDLLDLSTIGKELPPLPPNFDVDPYEPEFVYTCRKREHYGPEVLWTGNWNEEHWRTYLYVYYRFVEQADAQVGRVLSALRKAKQEDDTLVIFTSDHGEGMASHGWVTKLMLYEEEVMVPLIISWKGETPAEVMDIRHLTTGLDILPTMCDYAGIESPSEIHGQSLKTLIENPELPGAEFVVSELQPAPEQLEMKARMVRTGRHKYVTFSEGHNPELFFDLQDDPFEMQNLAREYRMKVEIERHRALLRQWIEKTDDRFTSPV